MHPFFSVTIFTGQQLVLEALQRWLTRPCTDAVDVQRQRRGLKGLLSLLIKTTATGMLATVLDAAIEFRRRQLLAAAAAEPDEGSAAAVARFPGLGMLSRAGIASWKARLLMGIDELERRAHAYGIESRHRFSPEKEAGKTDFAGGSGSKLVLAGSRAGSCLDLEEAERSERLGRTVEQLRELVKQGDPESQRRADVEVGSLVDLRLRAVGGEQEPDTPALTAELCHICMDRCVDVLVRLCHDSRTPAAASAAFHTAASQPSPGSAYPLADSPAPLSPCRWLAACTSCALAAHAVCATRTTMPCRSAPSAASPLTALWRLRRLPANRVAPVAAPLRPLLAPQPASALLSSEAAAGC
jgi:hypothetical protein